ncbi:serine O-acetyltransferase [Flavicella sediminum]|uniref:serine O-acetyltransferase n=1 Tax=Flavicella sediminum TaxID=2585141 RepID=UPI00111D9D44|nr:serine acetyltransferase [Flavicella sediminum]
MTQLQYFSKDLTKMLGKYKIRILHVWMSRVFWGIFMYRFERSLFLVFKKYYPILRVPFIPLFYMIQMYSNVDIHYKASIKGGLLVLHPACGVVISGQSVIGENLLLTGGNFIGLKKRAENGNFSIGDNCYMGANATLIGPLIIGNNVKIGASACVTKSFEADNIVLAGVPAKVM